MSNELTFYERQRLEYWLRSQMSLRDIGKLMRRTHTIVSREIRRNGNGDRKKYRADIAQRLFEKRKHKQHKGKLDKHPELKQYIVDGLKKEWSPEEIAGRLKFASPPELGGQSVSYESIYHYIYHKAEKWEKLFLLLPQRRVKRRKRGGRKPHNLPIDGRVSIHDRPLMVDERKRYGDWESDTIEFKRSLTQGGVSVQCERKSRLVRLHKVASKKSPEDAIAALIATAESVPTELWLSCTFDNGFENKKHHILKEWYNTSTYFCDPYSPWQKGTVENTNKLLRRYLPRHFDLNQLTDQELYRIQERLNDRPRKCLDYQTPNEVIHSYLQSGASKT